MVCVVDARLELLPDLRAGLEVGRRYLGARASCPPLLLLLPYVLWTGVKWAGGQAGRRE